MQKFMATSPDEARRPRIPCMGSEHAKSWTILEQVLHDPVSGLSIHFEVLADGSPRLRLLGDGLPYHNREFMFDRDGKHTGAGTDMARPDPN